MEKNNIDSGLTAYDIKGKLAIGQMLYTVASYREHRIVLSSDAEDRLLSILLQRKASRLGGNVEPLFSVQLTHRRENVTAQVTNPDGTIVTHETVGYGHNGFDWAAADIITDFVADAARDFMDTHFSAAAEQAERL